MIVRMMLIISDTLKESPGMCPSPILTMNQDRIARRVFAKECLRHAFRQESILRREYQLILIPPDVHGEFGHCVSFVDVNGNQPRTQLMYVTGF